MPLPNWTFDLTSPDLGSRSSLHDLVILGIARGASNRSSGRSASYIKYSNPFPYLTPIWGMAIMLTIHAIRGGPRRGREVEGMSTLKRLAVRVGSIVALVVAGGAFWKSG